jgi:hypothetical protein
MRVPTSGCLKPFALSLLVSLGLLWFTVAPVQAQSPPPPVATASQSFGFDYKDSDLSASVVTRFEMAIDAGAYVSVALPPVANDALTPTGSSTYKVPIPALVTGTHTVKYRACNASLCSTDSPVLTFVLAVQPPTPQTAPRILGTK